MILTETGPGFYLAIKRSLTTPSDAANSIFRRLLPVAATKFSKTLVMKIAPEADGFLEEVADHRACSKAAIVRHLINEARRSSAGRQDHSGAGDYAQPKI